MRQIFIVCMFSGFSLLFSCKKNEVKVNTLQGDVHLLGSDGDDIICRLIGLHDGGTILTGSITNGNKDIYLARFSKAGILLWENHYGTQEDDEGRDIYENDDGTLMVSGFTSGKNPGEVQMYLMKLDKDGHMLWDHDYAAAKATKFPNESADAIHDNSDGTYTLIGYPIGLNIFYATNTVGNHYIIVDHEGNLIKEKFYEYDFAGYTFPFVSRPLDTKGKNIYSLLEAGNYHYNFWLATDISNSFSSKSLDTNMYMSVTPTGLAYSLCTGRSPDSGLVFTTCDPIKSLDGETSVFKTNKDGKPIWKKSCPGFIQAMSVGANGQILLAGHRVQDNNVIARMMDNNGNTLWSKTFPARTGTDPLLNTYLTCSICGAYALPDGGSIIGATVISPSGRSSDILWMKLDAKGEILP